MRVYITAYQLMNFQSWDTSTKSISLEPDIVNIIEGANETGKSVLYKVLYNFAFPGYWDPKELIRRGCSSGVLLLELSNGKYIIFQLEYKHHTYILVDKEGEHVWKDCPLPKEIIDELGLILDYDLKIILNVIDKDIALPFIKTSPKFNASLIKARVEPPDITEFFLNADDTLKRVSDACLKYSTKTRELKAAADTLQYTDTAQLLEAKEKIDALFPVASAYSQLEKNLWELTDVVKDAPLAVSDPSAVAPHMEALLSLQNISKELSAYQEITSSKPQSVSSPENCKPLLECYDMTMALTACLQSHLKTLEATPEPIVCPNLDAELSTLNLLKQLKEHLAESNTVKSEVLNIQQQYSLLGDELEQMRKEVGVCPTCGRLLEDKHI